MKRRIGTWWKYQTPGDIEILKDLRRDLDFISVACDGPHFSKDFVRNCQDIGLEVLHLIDRTAGAYDSNEAAGETIDSIVAYAKEYGFNGVDLDYEAQPSATRAEYAAFMEALSERLHEEGLKLSICVGYYFSTHAHPPDHGFIDPVAVGKYCDEVRVMCYDQYFSPGKGVAPFDRLDCQGFGPTSSKPWAATAMGHWARYVPLEKLVMGLPAYSTDYDARPSGCGRHIYAPVPPANSWEYDKSWLWYESVNMYRYYDETGGPRIFYASDADSTRAHLDTAVSMNISAITFWEGHSVSPSMWQALEEWKNEKVKR